MYCTLFVTPQPARGGNESGLRSSPYMPGTTTILALRAYLGVRGDRTGAQRNRWVTHTHTHTHTMAAVIFDGGGDYVLTGLYSPSTTPLTCFRLPLSGVPLPMCHTTSAITKHAY